MPKNPDNVRHGRIGAHISWANTSDRSARTAPARAALEARFLAAAEGDPLRAESLRKAYYLQLAERSAQARKTGQTSKAKRAARAQATGYAAEAARERADALARLAAEAAAEAEAAAARAIAAATAAGGDDGRESAA